MTSLPTKRRVRVLVVEDSATSRELLVHLINADPRLQVAGTAADGEEAVQAAAHLAPDVITMDIHLPRLDGFEATRRIMESCPTRIVMVTASSIPHEVAHSFEALESGALTVLAKPAGPAHPDFAAMSDELLRTIALMAEVPVVRRWRPRVVAAPATPRPSVVAHGEVALVAIGASTGGPIALQAILSRLAPGFAAPVVVVQHIASGFTGGLVEWLSRSSTLPLRIATHAEHALPGNVYVAPDGAHTTLLSDGRIALTHTPPENGFRPAVSCLFRSAAQSFGPRAAGILLTGMGHDGARELKTMQQAGALTIVQDRASAVVYGMPGEALRLGAASHVLAPETAAATLNRLVQRRE
jgi:two-component system chemotaxis response regulator CheB